MRKAERQIKNKELFKKALGVAVIFEIVTLIIPTGLGGWGHAGPKNIIFLLFYIVNLPGLLLMGVFPPPLNFIFGFGIQVFLVTWLLYLFFLGREEKKIEQEKNEQKNKNRNTK